MMRYARLPRTPLPRKVMQEMLIPTPVMLMIHSITLVSIPDSESDQIDGGGSESVEEVPNDDAIDLPIPVTVVVTASATPGDAGCKWDLYDSGASHHMSPCREDFVDLNWTDGCHGLFGDVWTQPVRYSP